MSFSSNLWKTPRREIGLIVSPFVKIGTTFATFKELETQPVVNERLQMYSRGSIA